MKISWVFHVISPFSYLSLKQLPSLLTHVSVEFVPVLFAGLLDHYGEIGNAEIASKRRFTYRFALWRSRQLGIQMCLPPSHPFNPLMELRLIIAAGGNRRAVETVFDAVFMHGCDVSCISVINDLARALDVLDRQAALNDPAVKQRLRQNTEWAIARGVFGVPTFVIENEIFWGHDAFDMVLGYLLDPEQFQDAEMPEDRCVTGGNCAAEERATAAVAVVALTKWTALPANQFTIREHSNMDAVELTQALFESEASPGFRKKLAEREESISLCRLLFPVDFLRGLDIRTIDLARTINVQ